MLYCRGDAAVDKAKYFLSHAQSETVVDTVLALRNFQQRKRSASVADFVFFVDLVTIRQGVKGDFAVDAVWQLISDIGCIVLLAKPVTSPAALQRVWCVYEAFCGVDSGCEIEVTTDSLEDLDPIMARSAGSENHTALTADLMNVVQKVDVMEAEARDPNDKEMVLSRVKEIGPNIVNSIVATSIATALAHGTRERQQHLSAPGSASRTELSSRTRALLRFETHEASYGS
eukprot:TRINITY_DN57119_c0_g1_i1.p1 TRINITY_DN57119_c0_g1~~TRINITY_DN57119_c0_g1_i1.p1  ORF type:complete len:241 (+),score=29.92 TRINITY_DN57119_c0_g1_i1:36-725(+)